MDLVLWTLSGVVWVLGSMTLLVTCGFIFEIFKRKTRISAPGELIDIGGRNLHLVSLGQGGPSVIWEAGGGISSIATRSIQKQISKFTNVCVYDRAGYGWSDPVDQARTFDDLASDLEVLLKRAGIPAPYILVGESMGGLMARRFVSRNPGSVAALVLLDSAEEQHTFARLGMLRKMQKNARIAGLFAKVGVVRLLLNLFPRQLGLPSNVSPVYKKALIDDLARAGNFEASINEVEAYFTLAGEATSTGVFGRLGDIPLVVVSHGKALTGAQAFLEKGWYEAQVRLAGLSTNGRLITAADSGHAISIEAENLVVSIIRNLVDDYNAGLNGGIYG